MIKQHLHTEPREEIVSDGEGPEELGIELEGYIFGRHVLDLRIILV